MKYITAFSTTFPIGHHTKWPAVCAKPHGHDVFLEVGVEGSPLPEEGSYIVNLDALIREIDAIQTELSFRSLNDMIAPAKPTAAGLASWVWERLAMNFPVLSYVNVELGSVQARVEA